MNRLGIVALALVMGASEALHARTPVIVLNSEDASYSVLSRALAHAAIQRLPLGREPHHLIVTPGRQGSC